LLEEIFKKMRLTWPRNLKKYNLSFKDSDKRKDYEGEVVTMKELLMDFWKSTGKKSEYCRRMRRIEYGMQLGKSI
jgi:hypothetical protein